MKTILNTLVLILISISLTYNIDAQRRKRVKGQNITATTSNGKKVILRPNRTWTYDKTARKVSSGRKCSLRLEAAIVYRSGQVVPMARTTFYILDKDIITILKVPTFCMVKVQRENQVLFGVYRQKFQKIII